MFKITFSLLVYICKTFLYTKACHSPSFGICCHTTVGQANYISHFSSDLLHMEHKAKFAFSDQSSSPHDLAMLLSRRVSGRLLCK